MLKRLQTMRGPSAAAGAVAHHTPQSSDESVQSSGAVNAADPRETLATQMMTDNPLHEVIAHLRRYTAHLARLPRAHVDLWQSVASGNSATIPPRSFGVVLIDTIIYSLPAGGQLQIGTRIIPIPASQLLGTLPGIQGLVWRMTDPITLSFTGTAGPLHIEVIGQEVAASEALQIIS